MNVQEFLQGKLIEMRQRKDNPIGRIYCVYEIRIDDNNIWTLDLREEGSIASGAAEDPDCVLWLSSQTVTDAIERPETLWDMAGSAGLRTTNRMRAAQLLEAFWPGTIEKSAHPELVAALFPVGSAGLNTDTTTFFNEVLPSMLRQKPRMFGFVNAQYQFDFDQAMTWTVDLTGQGDVRTGPATNPKCVVKMSPENFENIIRNPEAVWPMFQNGSIRATNICRATQFFNGLFPNTLQRSMPPALFHAMFPNPSFSPSSSEYASGNGPKTGHVLGPDGPVEILYADVQGQAIYEGDIHLGAVEEMERVVGAVKEGVTKLEEFRVRGFRIIDWSDPSKYLWPGGVVFYNNTYTTDKIPQELQAAMANWTSNTKITFQQRTNQPNYISVKQGTGCSSPIGMQTGEQIITLEKNCGTGAIIHEIGHAVGLRHEHTRYDRNSYITIKFDNILDDKKYNFDIPNLNTGVDLGGYDYGSIMHYDAYAFSKNNKKTIEASQNIGQRSGLSAGDIAAVGTMYAAIKFAKVA